ncbi:MAG: hypothetical protein RL757_2081 [Bacteroidota bacterium]
MYSKKASFLFGNWLFCLKIRFYTGGGHFFEKKAAQLFELRCYTSFHNLSHLIPNSL